MNLTPEAVKKGISSTIQMATKNGLLLPDSIFSITVLIPDAEHKNMPIFSVRDISEEGNLGKKYARASRIIATRVWRKNYQQEELAPISSPFGKFWSYNDRSGIVVVCTGLQPLSLNETMCTLITSAILRLLK